VNRLHIRSIESVGAVEEGDNEPSKILFYKHRPPTEPEPGPVTKEGTKMPFDISTLDEDAQAYVRGLQAQVSSIEETPPLPDDLPEVVAKRLQAQDDAIEKERVEKERISKELADLLEERATERFTADAEAVAPILGKSDDVMPVLKELGTNAPEAYATLMAALRPLTSFTTLEKALGEYGTSQGGGSAIDQHAAFTTEIRKANPALSLADAKAQAWREHPELKRQLREEG